MPEKDNAKDSLKIDIVAHSRSKMIKERKGNLKVDDQQGAQPPEAEKMVSGIALY